MSEPRHCVCVMDAAGLPYVMGTIEAMRFLGTLDEANPPANPMLPVPTNGGIAPSPVASANGLYCFSGWINSVVPDVLGADGVTVEVPGTMAVLAQRALDATAVGARLDAAYLGPVEGGVCPDWKQRSGWVDAE